MVGWGQPQHGACRTRGDGCEETAEAERCEPGAPLCTWTNGEEFLSLSSSRGPREAKVKVRGGVGSATRRGDKPLRKRLGDRAAKSFATVGPLHKIASSTLASPLAVGGSGSRRWSGEVGARVLASAASEAGEARRTLTALWRGYPDFNKKTCMNHGQAVQSL